MKFLFKIFNTVLEYMSLILPVLLFTYFLYPVTSVEDKKVKDCLFKSTGLNADKNMTD